jgi:hypothetical protein
MTRSLHLLCHLVQFPCILLTLLGDVMCFLMLCLRSSAASPETCSESDL